VKKQAKHVVQDKQPAPNPLAQIMAARRAN